MPFDPTPWFVGGGAEHSPDVARLLSYLAAQRGEGTFAATDLEVRALDVPGASVRVEPGACSILNRTAGYSDQVYLARMPIEDTVAIAPTGSSGGRSDLVVARIEDPTLSGSPWSPPGDVTTGPYVFLRVIAGVPNTTTTVAELGLGYSAIPLARIDIPASTATITQSMIKDLRFLAAPRSWPEINAHALVTGEESTLDSTDTVNGQYWPAAVGRWFVPVPAWATKVRVQALLGSVLMPAGSNANGALWVQIGTNNDTNTYQTQKVVYDVASVPNNQRQTLLIADDVSVHPIIRGTMASFGIRGYKNAGTGTSIKMDAVSSLSLSLQFVEIPESGYQVF